MRAPVKLMALAMLVLPVAAFAYPEFQQYVQSTSGRNVNCAMCHSHPDGPDGVKAGQIGSLDSEELQRLNQARAAFEPGAKPDSPILNEFGDHIIDVMGRTKFISLRQHPEQLANALGDSDLDGDSMLDGEEYHAGTHPLDPRHGDPVRLFFTNLGTQKFHLAMILVATALGLFGLNNLIRYFGMTWERK